MSVSSPSVGRITQDVPSEPTRVASWRAPAAAGALVALGIFAWFVTVGGRSLFSADTFGNFYDAQADALLNGHWNVAPAQLFIEGFLVHGKTYTYFGVWPSLLRMPILAVVPSAFGKLTRLSMIGAFAVYLAGLCALHVRIRELWRPGRAWGAGERAVAFLVPVVGGCGTAALFLGSTAWVYHEAILWGAAWATVALERLVAFLVRPSRGRLVAASAAAALAFASRASVGTGVTFALGLVAVGLVLRWLGDGVPRARGLLRHLDWLAGPGIDDAQQARRWVLPTVAATLVPAITYAYVNWSRFGSLYSVPWRRQVLFQIDPAKARALDANGGTYFGVKFAPTTLLQFLRPDALAPNGLFPWVTFQRFPTTVVGHVRIDALDWTSSVTASMPLLLLLTAVAVVVVWTRPSRTHPQLVALRVPLLGAALGVLFVVTIAFVAQRYQGDWLPLLALGGLTGLYAVLDWLGRRRRATTVATVALLAVLAGVGLWVNGSFALLYQRLYAPSEPGLRAGLIDTQYTIASHLFDHAPQAQARRTLPARTADAGRSVVLGSCDALYWSDGRQWRFVQGTPAGGAFRFRGTPPPDDGRWHPLVSWKRAGGDEDMVRVRRIGDQYRAEYLRITAAGRVGPAAAGYFSAPSSAAVEFEVDTLRPVQVFQLVVDGRTVISAVGQHDLATRTPRLGRASVPHVARAYGGALRTLPADDGVCRRIRAALR